MSNKIWSFFIERRPITWLLLITIVAVGISSASTIPIELQPDISIPFGAVTTALPGANPSDVESLVTIPIEKQISGLDNIKSLTSSSGLGVSTIAVEFEADADIDQAINDLKDKVDLAKPDLPDDATDPFVIKPEANTVPIVNFSLSGDVPLSELTEYAKIVQDELERIPGVSSADIIGEQEKEIQVTLNSTITQELGITVEEVANTVKMSNANMPIGIITTDKINYSVRIDNRYQDIQDIREIHIRGDLLLKDIATVSEKYKEQSTISKLSVMGAEPQEAITIQVLKKSSGNIVSVADQAKEKITELQGTVIPDNINIQTTNDNAFYIRRDLGTLIRNGIQTTILITILLFLALGLREGVLAGLSIPLTLLSTIIALQLFGLTINSLTLFSLVIALGLMVDTAIVIMEGIHENLKAGMDSKTAAINSVLTYRWPLISGTLTTVFAFFPMLLVSGIVGQFLKSLPITISAALLSSIFISLTIIPAITVKLMKNVHLKKKSSLLQPIFDFLRKEFSQIISKIVYSRGLRVLVSLSMLGLFILSMSLPVTGALKVEMFPTTDVQTFIISIETHQGLVLNETTKIVEEVENKLQSIPEIENYLVLIGTNQGQVQTDLVNFGGQQDSNLANITINLVESDKRERRSYEVAQDVRKRLSNFQDADVYVQELTEGPPSDSAITINVTGPDYEVLKSISKDLQNIVKKVPNTENIRDNIEAGLNEFQYSLNRDALAHHGLSAAQVSFAIRNIIQGVEATEITLNNDDIKIMVQYDIEKQNNTPKVSIQDIENLEIPTPQGYLVPLRDLSSYQFGESIATINREDEERIIKVRSDVSSGGNAVTITQEIQKELESYEIPDGYDIHLGGDTEDIDESFRDLFRSMIIGVILIAVTLVLMFNSIRQPFIILLALPLALIGVFPGLALIGLNLSFPAFLGVVALSGVVVNDSIILIDQINQNRKNGMQFQDAIAKAASSRLQPIFMTSITTIIGILPLALTDEFWAGLGFSLVFGLAFSTVLTLVVTPVFYYFFEGRHARKNGEMDIKTSCELHS